MLDNCRILVVVPARGGSKGIKLKNLVPVNGVPLVAQVGKIIKQLPYVDRAIVSTDHKDIAAVAREAGLDVPFLRPKHLSGDFISDVQVLTDSLLTIEKIDNKQYDIIIMLQPTSPLRKPQHVTETVEKLIKGGYDAVWTVSKTDSKYHPYKQLVIDKDKIDYFDPRGSAVIARQQLSQLYHRNGAAYAITRDCLINQGTIKGLNTSAVLINDLMISIDSKFDVDLVEFVLKKHG